MRVITIGRSSENNIVINDVKVSRTHLQLVQNDNGVCSVVDLNTTNGTFVNGQKISGEVRLELHDVIRIGNTTLPWQEYLKQRVLEQKPNPPKTNRIWWYVAACVVIVLLAGGIGLYFYYDGEEQEKKELEQDHGPGPMIINMDEDAEQKVEEAKRLQKEADILLRKALISRDKKHSALAEAKQKEASEAKKEAEAANAAKRKADSDKIAAVKDAEAAKADKAKAIAEAERKNAAMEQKYQKDIQNTKEKARQDISKAMAERESEKKTAQLVTKFYEEFAEKWFDNNFSKKVCKQLQYELPKDKIAKVALKDRFSASDNKGKQAIIDAIQVVKQQNRKTKTNESETIYDTVVFADDYKNNRR